MSTESTEPGRPSDPVPHEDAPTSPKSPGPPPASDPARHDDPDPHRPDEAPKGPGPHDPQD
ncbi:hypothetical protein [Serinicoccus chungangensis]|uniref:hypothetical protein n=1 Tax=Serinicoccus chungangensis TaxID=767452 RepID=UPI00111912CB|nr:hypothetical protein [Serinicoccus chungangensis]